MGQERLAAALATAWEVQQAALLAAAHEDARRGQSRSTAPARPRPFQSPRAARRLPQAPHRHEQPQQQPQDQRRQEQQLEAPRHRKWVSWPSCRTAFSRLNRRHPLPQPALGARLFLQATRGRRRPGSRRTTGRPPARRQRPNRTSPGFACGAVRPQQPRPREVGSSGILRAQDALQRPRGRRRQLVGRSEQQVEMRQPGGANDVPVKS